MKWSEPTRVVCLLTVAVASHGSACERPDPPAALAAPRPAAPPATTAVASAVPSATADQASAEPDRPLTRVLVLGDSLSDEQVGGGGYVRVLRERCQGVSFDNRARGGFMVNQIRRRLESEVLPDQVSYSHAIVFGGVNDLYSDQTAQRTLPRIEADLTRIYGALQQRGVKVIAITVTPWGGFKRWFTPERSQSTLALNRWILARPSQGGVASAVDAYPLLSCGDPERLCPALALPHKDGLHFGKLGHEKLAFALLDGPFKACRG